MKRKGKESAETSKRPKIENQTVYVKNLNDKINPAVLKLNLYLLCSGYGDVIDIIIKPKSKRMRGQAHIIFGCLSEATQAVEHLNSMEFFNKPLYVDFATKKSKVIKRVELME